MVLFNYSTRELTAKIVYYGPGLCGKTTNLQYIHGTLPDNVRGKMLSLATKTDRTLFFDFLPIDLGQIRGMKTRVQLYTVPGQVFYNETRKLVLKGADGIVFVADSQSTMLGANIESFKNLEENLKAHGMTLADMPHVLQFNKRDLPKLSSIEELNAAINRFNAPFYESVATTGIGVQDTLKAITKLVLLHLTRKYDPKTAPAAKTTQRPAVGLTGAPPLAVEAPAGPAPSLSQTMQMPAVDPRDAFAPGGTHPRRVPLSSDPAAFDPLAASPAPSEPAFEDREIQDLVDEVQEVSTLSAAGVSLAPETPETSAWDAPAPSEPPDLSSGVAEAGGGPSFEIDHGVDPDLAGAAASAARRSSFSDAPRRTPADSPPAWELGGDDGQPATEDAAPGRWDLGSFDEPSRESETAPDGPPFWEIGEVDASAADRAPAGGLPTLTEVVSDVELFDGTVDVARLTEGQEQELVVPVEIEQADRSVRRLKLSIRLRIDPVV
ncbi:MAG TPA: hypothetical protein VD788_10130 [Candidatus Polarisedimenticolaceae bacterium]|nr:hypothetical protein [Candidatus Polarisedimenticolaceae bacterium]